MKLLLDQNLSWRLLGSIRRQHLDSTHVVSVGLYEASDREVWEYAKANGYTICSKDTDFRQLSFLHGAPPKVIWLDVGNRSTDEIALLLENNSEALADFERSEEALLAITAGTIS